jgi:RNA polymerase sigma factor (TIGR02999 family)
VSDRNGDAEVTQILSELVGGDGRAADRLLPLVYDELRRRASFYMAQQNAGHTLQATALVHDAYVKLVGAPDGASARDFQSRQHFFHAAAEAMRQILVDHARARRASKRGGTARKVSLDDLQLSAADLGEAVSPGSSPVADDEMDWEALDRALNELKRDDPRRHQVVMYRYFAGLTNAEVAQLMGVSDRTVERDWSLARAYLAGKLST